MKKLTLFVSLVVAYCFMTNVLQAQVAINTDGTPPHTSAMLEVKSTSKGLLIPRLNTTQRTTLGGIATAGLMVYDYTLNKFYFHNGSGWVEASTGNLWSRTGSITYTTNLSDNVGIGTSSPGYVAGATRYLSISTPALSGVNQTASLELKGAAYNTYNPVNRIDFLSGTYNIARIETRITNSLAEG